MDKKYNKGSEWRKWDLHVHTASSYDYKFKGDNPNEVLVKSLRDNKISAIAITDHFIIDKNRVEGLRSLAPDIVFFPGVELRTDKGGSNIHPIIIFNENINLSDLVEDFNVFKREKAKDKDCNEKIRWDYNDIVDFSQKHDGIITIHAGSKTNGIDEQISNVLPIKIAIKEEYADTISIFEIGKIEDIEEYKTYKFPKIGIRPLIIGSDNHNPLKYPNDRNNSIFTWIKANPTFEGLKQIINEPERIFIGEKPEILKRIETSPTKFIKNITIQKKSDSTIDEKWYGNNTSIDINPGLVAVIGNKGSGKSAITDIISVCANTHITDFSFLSSDKFRNPKPYDRSKAFEAKITWCDDSSTAFVSLNNDGDINQPERVKYIPQNYLETLCTIEDDNTFEDEIKSIIFQHLSEEGKYGKQSLDDVIDYLSVETKNAEKEIAIDIQSQNEKIIALEEKKRPEYAEKLKNELKLKNEELDNLNKIKPTEIEKPNHTDNEEELQKQKEIDDYKKQLVEIDKQITAEQNKLNLVKKHIVELGNAKERLDRINSTIQSIISDLESLFLDLGLSIREIISFSIDNQTIDNKLGDLKAEEKRITDLLSEDNEGGLVNKKQTIESNIKDAENKLSEPDKLYHKYQEELKEWQSKVDVLVGKDDIVDSLKYYEAQLNYIAYTLDNDLQTAYENRKKLILSLLDKKREELNKRAILYQPVSDFIRKYNEVLKDYPISIDAVFIFDGIEKLFDIVSHQSSGTFYGKDNGMLKLRDMKSAVDLSSNNSIYAFASSLNEALKKDLRDTDNIVEKDVKSQLKKDYSIKDLYDFIYGLEYIKPLFELKLDGKKLSTLSPGERGALLLLFYLFIDMDDKPLIIDQPEENLDNESVFKYLVKFIKMAKDKRQVIIVTHNPNLAVVCDAEQIIKMEIDKKDKNKVSFVSGSIEDPGINKCIVDILEGTYPAFHNRDQKYINKE